MSSWVRMPRTPPVFTARGLVLCAIILLALWSIIALGLTPAGLVPHEGGWALAKKFFARAFSPALDYESSFVPEGTPPILYKALDAARREGMDAILKTDIADLRMELSRRGLITPG